MKFLYKLEQRFGKYAITGLIRYIVMLEVLGVVLTVFSLLMNPGGTSIYMDYLALDVEAVLRGQVWRLFTFLIGPGVNLFNLFDVIFFAFRIYLYLFIGNSLESAWGPFRFNLYYFAGIVLNVLAAFIIYFATGQPYGVGLEYLNLMLFMAFTVIFPNMQLLLFFIIPIKVKWLGIVYAFFWVYQMLIFFVNRDFASAFAIFLAMANFAVFFLSSRNYKQVSLKERRRRSSYRKQVRRTVASSRHKCAVCGRTEEDDDSLEFRYCSKCEGNFEYCSDHLFTHEHVRKR